MKLEKGAVPAQVDEGEGLGLGLSGGRGVSEDGGTMVDEPIGVCEGVRVERWSDEDALGKEGVEVGNGNQLDHSELVGLGTLLKVGEGVELWED